LRFLPSAAAASYSLVTRNGQTTTTAVAEKQRYLFFKRRKGSFIVQMCNILPTIASFAVLVVASVGHFWVI